MRLRPPQLHRLHVLAVSSASTHAYVQRNDVIHLLLAGRPHEAWHRRSTVERVLTALHARPASSVGDELRALASVLTNDVLAALGRLLDARGGVLARAGAWPDRGRAFVQVLWEHGESGVLADWLATWLRERPGWTWLARAPRPPFPTGPQRAWSFPRPIGHPCLGRVAGAAVALRLDDSAAPSNDIVYWWRRNRIASQAWHLVGRRVARAHVSADLILAWDGEGEIARLDTATGRTLVPVVSQHAPVAMDGPGWYLTRQARHLHIWHGSGDAPVATLSADPDATIVPGRDETRWFLVRDAGGLRSWTAEHRETRLVDDPRRARYIATTASDRILVAGTRSVRFVDVRTGTVSGTRDVHTVTEGLPLRGCAVRADGRRGAVWTEAQLLVFDDVGEILRVEAIRAVRRVYWIGDSVLLDRMNDVPMHVSMDDAPRALTQLHAHVCAVASDAFVLFRRRPEAHAAAAAITSDTMKPPSPTEDFFDRILAGEIGTAVVTERGDVRDVTPPDAAWPAYVAAAGTGWVVSSAPAGRTVHAWRPTEPTSCAALVAGFASSATVLANGDAFVVVGARLHSVDLERAIVRGSIDIPGSASTLTTHGDAAHLWNGGRAWRVVADPLRLEPVDGTAPSRVRTRSGRPSHRAPLQNVRWYDDGWWFTAGDDGRGHVLCFGPRGVVVLHALRDGRPWHARRGET